MKSTFLFLVLAITGIGFSYAQQLESALLYYGQTKFDNSRFGIYHEAQLRDFQFGGDHNQTLIRVGGRYQIKPFLTAIFGYGFIYSELKGDPNAPFNEHRIFQDFVLTHVLKSTRIRHRLRLEERFIEDRDVYGRARYCLFADIPLSEKNFNAGGTYLALYEEAFINVLQPSTQKTFDRNRIYAGVGYKVKDNLGIQLGSMLQHVGSNKGTFQMQLSFHHVVNVN
ncbi:DUF2490 domain-containing protein [Sphingobacterium hotanense]|uniref:DUF2490 domain-containing protein n=1 Tax=Sphingobacterium hotanense TaxID=649196 RepID=UPI0011F205B8|nr:DUF2490 domain-containing protein [Sphingobacterium hotanense]